MPLHPAFNIFHLLHIRDCLRGGIISCCKTAEENKGLKDKK